MDKIKYVIVSGWAMNGESDVNVVGIFENEREAQKRFEEYKVEERMFAGLNDWTIYEDSLIGFDAGKAGYYGEKHSRAKIVTIIEEK